MNTIEYIYQLSLQLNERLEQDHSKQDRAQVVDDVNDILDERGRYLEDAPSPETDEEKQWAAHILEMEPRSQAKLETLFTGLKAEMKSMKKQKSSNRKYVNPYQNVATSDGMFLDKKK
ncbi:flagellar protein FliT [Thalassobacillus sp. CUG 92003]|uniref:flagellar protein FliT n=1 Tax=Thalassobacillus sp. CUG 92003 TaxID=2736641 RepID=UPI0015E6ACE9|nr:flagellar protein FliT [Thalassobacillus sp. CUG 92003]